MNKISSLAKTILIGSGGGTIDEIAKSIEIIKKNSNDKSNVVLLHGFQAYPTVVEDTNLDRLKIFKEVFDDIEIGISDHIAGDNLFSSIIPMMAIPYGITYVEKHITLDRHKKE